jgi:hypothetical protein
MDPAKLSAFSELSQEHVDAALAWDAAWRTSNPGLDSPLARDLQMTEHWNQRLFDLRDKMDGENNPFRFDQLVSDRQDYDEYFLIMKRSLVELMNSILMEKYKETAGLSPAFTAFSDEPIAFASM